MGEGSGHDDRGIRDFWGQDDILGIVLKLNGLSFKAREPSGWLQRAVVVVRPSNLDS